VAAAAAAMSEHENEIEKIARAFHEVYERLAPNYGWGTQKRSRVAWEALPPQNRDLMIATISFLIAEDVILTPNDLTVALAEQATANRHPWWWE
jgi:hypothetical protein